MGLDLSVEGSDLYMLGWEAKFLRKLVQLGWEISFYKRYVDDVGSALLALNKGWIYSAEKDKMEYVGGGDNGEVDDIRTFKVLCQIGNTIDPNIQLEPDAPSLHGDGILPILDLKVWVENGTIRHRHYRKEVASKKVIMERSAVSNRTKRDTLFQEGIRRIRNMDTRTQWRLERC